MNLVAINCGYKAVELRALDALITVYIFLKRIKKTTEVVLETTLMPEPCSDDILMTVSVYVTATTTA